MIFRRYGTSPRHNFHIVDYHHILSLKTSVMTLRHDLTNHTFVHLERDDPHLVHGIAIRTPPSNNKGIPHILEHLSLCGSKNYPVRDPFFKMLNRSLASYMNAWTASDHTFYPFATENKVDFKNLRSIYMDAVFRPFLREIDFKQEAWRLDNDLGVKGVVYNEMKGSLSDVGNLFIHRLHSELFENSFYSYNSGGEPNSILDLRPAEIKEFYVQKYTPENSLTVAYGNIDLEEELKFLDENLPRGFPELELPESQLEFHKSTLNSWKNVVINGPMDSTLPADRQVRYIKSFLCNTSNDSQEVFEMRVLSNLLLEGPASPLYQALLESNIGTEYAPGTGYDSSTFETTFSVGLQGIKEEDIPKVDSLIVSTLNRVEEEGFSSDRIEGVLHQINLDLRNHSTQFGIRAASNIVSAWTHGTDLSNVLDIDARLENFDPDGLKKLIRKHLLENKRGIDFVMKPEAQYNENIKKEEVAKIEDFIQTLNPFDKEQIKLDNELLGKEQSEQQNYNSILPILTESDLNPQLRYPSMKFISWPDTGMKQQYIKDRYIKNSPLSNNLTFVRLLGIQRLLPGNSDLYYLPLALSLLTELGIKEKSSKEFDSLLKRTCGGLSIDAFLNSKDQKCDLRVQLATWALDSKISDSIELFRKVLLECKWDDYNKIKTLIGQSSANSLSGIAQSGHLYAAIRAASQFGGYFDSKECLNGLKQVMFQQRLFAACEVPSNLENISRHLQHISHHTFNQMEEWRSAIISGENSEDFDLHDKLLVRLPTTEPSFRMILDEPETPPSYSLNSNYTAKCYLYNKPKISFKERAAIQIIIRLIGSKVLHPLIREHGGAYGSSINFDSKTGLLTLTSYRDPTPEKSIEIFSDLKKLISLLANSTNASSEYDYILRESKLNIFQQLDAPLDLSAQGLHRFKTDLEDEEIYKLKKAVLDMEWREVWDLSQSYLFGPKQESHYILRGH
jgi:presequence protease